jgi:hypothetical protein
MERSPRRKKSFIRKVRGRFRQERARRQRQWRHQRPAVILKPESRRTAGGVEAALALRLDEQDSSMGGKLRSKAGAGDSAADDQDVNVVHRRAGYGLESRSV